MKIKLLILFSILSFLFIKSNCITLRTNYFYDNTNLYYLEPIESILNELYSYTLIIVNIFI